MTYELLKDPDLGLEALPVLDLGSRDLLDGAALPRLDMCCRANVTIGALAQGLPSESKRQTDLSVKI